MKILLFIIIADETTTAAENIVTKIEELKTAIVGRLDGYDPNPLTFTLSAAAGNSDTNASGSARFDDQFGKKIYKVRTISVNGNVKYYYTNTSGTNVEITAATNVTTPITNFSTGFYISGWQWQNRGGMSLIAEIYTRSAE